MTADHYHALIDSLVSVKVQGKGRQPTFQDLLHSLPGVFPSVLRESLERLGKQLTYDSRRWSVPPSGEPIPHPADADWRFDRGTRRLLTTMLGRWDATRVVLLGCPSLLASLCAIDRYTCITVVDANAKWRAYFEGRALATFLNADVGQTPVLVADLAVLDPPWYNSELARFLHVASQTVRPGGVVMLSVPPVGTRPNIHEDLKVVLNYAATIGLQLSAVDSGALRYSTPWFETQALRALGFPALGNWRSGDLYTFIASDSSLHRNSTRPAGPSSAGEWLAHDYRSLRLCIRETPRPPVALDPRLTQLVPGDILPSVSRRHELLPRVMVWTAGNRVYGCADTSSLMMMLVAMEAGQDHLAGLSNDSGRRLSDREIDMVQEAFNQIQVIEASERDEYDTWRADGLPDELAD